MTQLTEISMSWITVSFVIRLVIVGALIHWTTRWDNGKFWSTKDEKAGLIIGIFFLVIHFAILPMWKLALFNEHFVSCGGSTLIEYFLFDLVFRIVSLFYWGVIYALILTGLNLVVHYAPNVGNLIRTVETIVIIGLCIYPGCWLIFIWPFTIQ